MRGVPSFRPNTDVLTFGELFMNRSPMRLAPRRPAGGWSPILRISAAALFVLSVCGAGWINTAYSEPITYTLTDFPSLQDGWTVSGHITTNGTLGSLLESDITAWDYTFAKGAETFTGSSTTGGVINPFNFALVEASATEFKIGLTGSLMLVSDSSYSNLLSWAAASNNYNSQAPAGNVKWSANPSSQYVGGAWTIATVPEPSTYALTLAGAAYGGFLIWRRRKRA